MESWLLFSELPPSEPQGLPLHFHALWLNHGFNDVEKFWPPRSTRLLRTCAEVDHVAVVLKLWAPADFRTAHVRKNHLAIARVLFDEPMHLCQRRGWRSGI